MNRKDVRIAVFFQSMLILLSTGFCSRAAEMPLLQGQDLNPLVIDSQRLDWHKVAIRDILAEQERVFIPSEKKAGFKSSSYLKIILRDSKLPCFLYRYDRNLLENFKGMKMGDRVTLVGTLERLGKGAERYYNPKFVLRVEELRKGWTLGEGETVLAAGEAKNVSFQDVSPEIVANVPEEYDGKYIRFQDRFSLLSSYFTNFEKDLDLSGATALKFRGEFFPWPCYLPKTEESVRLVSHLKTGDKITISGKLLVRPLSEDRLVLLAVQDIKEGWE